MPSPEKITVDGVDYFPAAPKSDDVKILVLQRGWNVVGRYSKDGSEHVLTDASVIRYWGTTRGLGEIAAGGPTPTTKLDPCGTVRAHELTTALVMDADAVKWSGRL
jgi:hypothetical protein